MRLSKGEFKNLVSCYIRLEKFTDDVFKAFGIKGELSALDECLNDLYMNILDLCGYTEDFYDKLEDLGDIFYETVLDRFLFEDPIRDHRDLDDVYEKISNELEEFDKKFSLLSDLD